MIVDELYTVEIWLQHDTDYRDKTCLRLREDIGQIEINGPTKEYTD